MYYDAITSKKDIVLTAEGLVQCGDNHYDRTYSWSRKPTIRPAAVDAWVQFSDGGQARYLMFTCKRHSGTTKSTITRGGYNGRGVEPLENYGISLASAVADPATTLKTVTLMEQKTRDEGRRRSDINMREHQIKVWDERRADYDANDKVEFLSFDMGDDYGRVYVGLKLTDPEGYGWRTTEVKLTPAQVRQIVKFGGAWADNAERLTHDAKPPTVTAEEHAFLYREEVEA